MYGDMDEYNYLSLKTDKMKASELVALLQKKIERYGDWDIMANTHKITGIRAIRLATKMLFMIEFNSYTHDPFR